MKDLETKLLESAIPPEYKHGRLPLLPSQIQVNIFLFYQFSQNERPEVTIPIPKMHQEKKKNPIKESLVYYLLSFVFQRNWLLFPKLISN